MLAPANYAIYSIDPGPSVCHGVQLYFAGGLVTFVAYHSFAPEAFDPRGKHPVHAQSLVYIEQPEAIYRPAAACNLLLTARAAGLVGGIAATLGWQPLTYVKPTTWRRTINVLTGEGGRKAAAIDARIKAFVCANVQGLQAKLSVHAYDCMGLTLAAAIERRIWVPRGWHVKGSTTTKPGSRGRLQEEPFFGEGRFAGPQTGRRSRKGRRHSSKSR